MRLSPGPLYAIDLAPTIVLTGQHAQLEPVAFALAAHPLVRLHCAAKGEPRLHAEAVAKGLAPALRGTARPDLLIVQGDTSSALGRVFAAAASGVPLAHVEAGLRSHDLAMPWPEVGNQVDIDRLAQLLFAATGENATNLAHEGVSGEVHVTGNTAMMLSSMSSPPPRRVTSIADCRGCWSPATVAKIGAQPSRRSAWP